MSVKAQVFVTCDARRTLGRYGRHDFVTTDLTPAAWEARGRRAARGAGWAREPVDGGPPGALRDVCPECAGARLAGIDGPPRPELAWLDELPPPPRVPRTIGEAAEVGRRRREPAGEGRPDGPGTGPLPGRAV
jgi:hypothetical protein